MIEKIRQFCKTPVGMAVVVIAVLVGLYLGYRSISGFVTSDAEQISRDRLFIDATTGKPFEHTVHEGDHLPLKAPSGGDGWPAELCYWNKDGTIRKDPFAVLLNNYVHKPGPTFCPDCGRLVVGHNPAPGPDSKPPPTEAEYKAHPHSSEPMR